jgi:hypothetical protein
MFMLTFAKVIQQRHGFACRRFARAMAITLSLLVPLGRVIVTWAGGDPWKSKPYQQWDSKDILKIVNDSPWAKLVRVDAPWKNAAGADDGAGSLPPGGIRPTMGAMGGQPSSAPPNSAGSGQISQIPQATFLVRWVSSRTIREAVLRTAVLSGGTKEEDAEKDLAHPVDAYQVFVTGADMKPFAGVDEDELKRGTVLVTRKAKQKIIAAKVDIERTSDGAGVQAIVFSFPRKFATGEATIGAEEKGADFTCVAGTVRIQATFDISKMDDAQGRDL